MKKSFWYIVGALLGIWLFSLCVSCKKTDTAPQSTPKHTTDTIDTYAQWQWLPREYEITTHSWSRGKWCVGPNNNGKTPIAIYAEYLPGGTGQWTQIPAYNIFAAHDSLYLFENSAVDYDSNLFHLSNYAVMGYGGFVTMRAIVSN
ncbi:MAG: hypothetical protein ACHP6H_05190 [Legionellales bacterium]